MSERRVTTKVALMLFLLKRAKGATIREIEQELDEAPLIEIYTAITELIDNKLVVESHPRSCSQLLADISAIANGVDVKLERSYLSLTKRGRAAATATKTMLKRTDAMLKRKMPK